MIFEHLIFQLIDSHLFKQKSNVILTRHWCHCNAILVILFLKTINDTVY